MSVLSDDGEIVARLLGFEDTTDNALIDRINDCVDVAENRLLVRINEETVPAALKYIVSEVAVKRYNRIGSEGTSSHTVEGESMAWSEDDFAEFEADIAYYLSNNSKARPHIKFI